MHETVGSVRVFGTTTEKLCEPVPVEIRFGLTRAGLSPMVIDTSAVPSRPTPGFSTVTVTELPNVIGGVPVAEVTTGDTATNWRLSPVEVATSPLSTLVTTIGPLDPVQGLASGVV